MADREDTLAGGEADYDGTEEPVLKKPRSSSLKKSPPDCMNDEQRTCVAELGECVAAATLTRPAGEETEMVDGEATVSARGDDNNGLLISESTSNCVQTFVSAPEFELSGIQRRYQCFCFTARLFPS